MKLKWTVSDDCKTYTALTNTRVYEILLLTEGSTECEIRYRQRARRVDVPLHDQWSRFDDTYKNPTVAMVYAQAEEEGK